MTSRSDYGYIPKYKRVYDLEVTGTTSLGTTSTGAASATTLTTSGAATLASAGVTGALSAASMGVTGAIGAGSVSVTGLTSSANLSTTGAASFASATVTNGITANGDIVASNEGEVTQITSLSTGVTINTSVGTITTVNATISGTTYFTVTNSKVTPTSVILLSVNDYSGTYGTNGFPNVEAENIASGSFQIVVKNMSTTSLNGIIKIVFMVIN